MIGNSHVARTKSINPIAVKHRTCHFIAAASHSLQEKDEEYRSRADFSYSGNVLGSEIFPMQLAPATQDLENTEYSR